MQPKLPSRYKHKHEEYKSKAKFFNPEDMSVLRSESDLSVNGLFISICGPQNNPFVGLVAVS
jgi:hypothetical protein